jgi:hypothetical protein
VQSTVNMDADIALSEWGSAAAAVQLTTVRTTTTTATFRRPFSLLGADRMVPAGDYRVVTDEELIERIVVSGLPAGLDRGLSSWNAARLMGNACH